MNKDELNPLIKEEEEKLFVSPALESAVDVISNRVTTEEVNPNVFDNVNNETYNISKEDSNVQEEAYTNNELKEEIKEEIKTEPVIEEAHEYEKVDNDVHIVNEIEEPKKIEPKESKKIKIDKSLIFTIISGIIVCLLLFVTVKGYYMGFKYKDYNSKEEVKKPIKETEIGMDSVIVQQAYEKVNVSTCSKLMVSSLYNNKKVTVNELSDKEISILLYNYFTNNVCSESISKTNEEVKKALVSLFGSDTKINSLINLKDMNFEVISVNYDNATSTFNFKVNDCNICTNETDMVKRSMEKATSSDEYLFIYERFGIFKLMNENNYNVYGYAGSNELLTTYIKVNNSEFIDFNILKEYKLTYKKGQNNDYYFVSIEAV